MGMNGSGGTNKLASRFRQNNESSKIYLNANPISFLLYTCAFSFLFCHNQSYCLRKQNMFLFATFYFVRRVSKS